MKVPVYGMTCGRCEAKVAAVLEAVPGVKTVRVDRSRDLAVCDAPGVPSERLEQAVIEAGYQISAETEEETLAPASAVETPGAMVRLSISGMSCASCVRSVEQALSQVSGVESVAVNYAASSAQVRGEVEFAVLVKAVKAAGYDADVQESLFAAETAQQLKQDFLFNGARALLALIVGASLMFAGATVESILGWHVTGWLVFAILILTGGRYYLASWHQLKQGRASMDSLIALGTGSAWIYSMLVLWQPNWLSPESGHLFFEAALFIMGFVHLGKSLEEYARGKTSIAIGYLLELQPAVAVKETSNGFDEVQIADVELGDRLLIKAGEVIPLDGRIVSGSGSVDEQMITGEALPVARQPHDQVIGGTINLEGSLVVEVTAIGDQTLLGRMTRAVAQAQNSKPQLAHLADTISAWFVPGVMLFALVSAAGWWVAGQDPGFCLSVFMTVLVVACPCALGLAIPLSVMVGLGRGAEMGFLVRHSDSLQQASRLDTIVIDKTGTLTEGKPAVVSMQVAPGASQSTFSSVLKSLEAESLHPLAMAIVKELPEVDILPLESVRTVPGSGIKATWQNQLCLVGNEQFFLKHGYPPYPSSRPEGSSLVFAGLNGQWLGVVAAQDQVRSDAASVISRLQRRGLKVVLLSGDNNKIVHSLAQHLGIVDARGEMSPEEKRHHIEWLQNQGAKVGMVGDGINDSLALSQADVGFAMGAGSDIAIESADVSLLGGSLSALPKAIDLSAKVLRNIKQNLAAAFVYNVCLLPVAAGLLYPAFGLLLHPAMAGLAMALSSLSVVANALRLRLMA